MPASNHSRRKFIKQTTQTGLFVAGAGALHLNAWALGGSANNLQTGFDQTPLPYTYAALESFIDTATMELHYSKHAAAYAKNLKEAVVAENINTQHSLEAALATTSKYSTKFRNNGGGHYNHELFWRCMKPGAAAKPEGALAKAIDNSFNSFEAFKTQFADAAKSRFGSGWAWLIISADKKLKIIATANQDNPLMDIAEVKGTPILALDVWEHAYYLKYQNRRPEYIENWFKTVNWEFVAQRFLGI
jgi:superoxide dismutase, Fe-Mn family